MAPRGFRCPLPPFGARIDDVPDREREVREEGVTVDEQEPLRAGSSLEDLEAVRRKQSHSELCDEDVLLSTCSV